MQDPTEGLQPSGQPEYDIELTGSMPPAPEATAPGGDGAPNPPSVVRLKIRDQVFDVPEDALNAIASATGRNADSLIQVIQTGVDAGNQYRRSKELYDRAMSMMNREPAPSHEPASAPVTGRTLAEVRESGDTLGVINWMAEQMSVIPALQTQLVELSTRAEQAELLRLAAEERVEQRNAFDRVMASRRNYKDPRTGRPSPRPTVPYEDAKAIVERWGLSDDLDATWDQIWENSARILTYDAAPERVALETARHMRGPEATVPVAGGPGARPMPQTAAVGATPLDQEIQGLWGQIGPNTTFAEAWGVRP